MDINTWGYYDRKKNKKQKISSGMSISGGQN